MSLTTDQSAQISASPQKDRDQPRDSTHDSTEPSRQVSWYHPTLESVPDTAREILRDYSGIPEAEILDHIYRIRDKAWKTCPYPCIGIFRFLDFCINQVPVYPEVLRRVKAGETLLDLGCCFGQDVRKLVSDGAPSENVVGVDIEAEFAELGYELFRDRGSLKSRFYAQSVFDEEFLSDWYGKVDIIYVGAFLHLFTMDKQMVVMRQIDKLLRRGSAVLVFGRHLGAERGGDYKMESSGWDVYRHSPDTITELFNSTGDLWDVSSQLTKYEPDGSNNCAAKQQGEDTRLMTFVARRLVEKQLDG